MRWVMWKRVHASLTGISAFICAIKFKFVSVIALNSRQKRSCHHFGRVFNNRTSFNFISCEEVQKFKTADIFHVRLDKKIVNSNDKLQFVHDTAILDFKDEVPKMFPRRFRHHC